MSSSPKLARVQTFEYHGPRLSRGRHPEARPRVGSYAPNGPAGRHTPEQLELKLAAARAEGIREGLQQAQAIARKELAENARRSPRHPTFSTEDQRILFARRNRNGASLPGDRGQDIASRGAGGSHAGGCTGEGGDGKLQQARRRPSGYVRKKWPTGTATSKATAAQKFGSKSRPILSVEAHNCILETELGTTELGLEAQLKEIEQGFFDLLAQRPDNK